MRSYKILFIMFNLLVAKDITYKIHTSGVQEQHIISLNGGVNDNNILQTSRTSREDTSTVWLQDFEGDISLSLIHI